MSTVQLNTELSIGNIGQKKRTINVQNRATSIDRIIITIVSLFVMLDESNDFLMALYLEQTDFLIIEFVLRTNFFFKRKKALEELITYLL